MINKQNFSILAALLFYVLLSGSVFAQEVDDVAESITESARLLPSLVSAFAYLSGVLIAVTAIIKVIEHVENPMQVPIRVPVVRFLIGGALFALPIVIEAAYQTINGGGTAGTFDPDTSVIDSASNTINLAGALTGSFASILNSIMQAINELPALVSVVAYLLGLLMAVSAVYKTRDHVEDPDRTPLKDVVIRYIVAGALFALPTVFEALYNTFSADGILGTLAGFGVETFMLSTFLTSSFAGVTCPATGGGLDSVICTVLLATGGLPAFLTAISYLIGLVFGLWGILKIRDHVNNPQQTVLSEGVTRLLASGAFFSLPVISMTLAYSVTPLSSALTTAAGSNTSFNENVTCDTTNTLDEAMVCFMNDVLGPSHVLLNFFSFVAGLIFIMIGISRLIRSAQEGARGPGGLGTVTTFVVGAVLLSATTIMHAFSVSFFNSGTVTTNANLVYTTGMSTTETQAAHNVISAVLKFMIIIGMISFVRGIFIMRDVSEGNQQASVMAGMTHIIGGALAVNLGPLIDAVQTTLGVTAFGVTFS